MVQVINDAKPDVLWVGMTAPKQEKWVEVNRQQSTSRSSVRSVRCLIFMPAPMQERHNGSAAWDLSGPIDLYWSLAVCGSGT